MSRDKLNTIDFRIVTPEGPVYVAEIEKVTVPTTSGEITILPTHAPLVSILQTGELVAMKDGEEVSMAVSGGFLEVRDGSRVYIMADTAERAEHIDVTRAEEARARAEELLAKQTDMADVDFARIQAVIEREMARISVANKYRK
jgi:F-type H+-transporting ATPase subunit epsilon